MNKDILAGNWKQIKGEIRRTWGKLTDDEIEQAKGSAESIAGLVQTKFGTMKEEAQKKVNEIITKYDKQTNDAKKSI